MDIRQEVFEEARKAGCPEDSLVHVWEVVRSLQAGTTREEFVHDVSFAVNKLRNGGAT